MCASDTGRGGWGWGGVGGWGVTGQVINAFQDRTAAEPAALQDSLAAARAAFERVPSPTPVSAPAPAACPPTA